MIHIVLISLIAWLVELQIGKLDRMIWVVGCTADGGGGMYLMCVTIVVVL